MKLSTAPFYIKPSKQPLHTESKMKINNRTYKCKLCEKKFKQSGHLDTHLRLRHSHVKNHHCPYSGCDKSFPLLWALRSHMVTHKDEKRFKCSFTGCSEAFHQKFQRDIHFNSIHLNVWHICECSKKFAHVYALKYHRKRCLKLE